MEATLLYVQNKEKKTERLDLRVKPSTIEALELLNNLENYHVPGLPGNFSQDSVSDVLEYGLKILLSRYLKHDSYKHLYPDVELLYPGLYGNDIVRINGPHTLVFEKENYA